MQMNIICKGFLILISIGAYRRDKVIIINYDPIFGPHFMCGLAIYPRILAFNYSRIYVIWIRPGTPWNGNDLPIITYHCYTGTINYSVLTACFIYNCVK